MIYGVIALNPWLVFAHELRSDNVVFHAREPFPENALDLARSARARVASSPYYEPGDEYHVYFCDTPALFALFTLWNRNVGAVSQVGLTGDVFVRPARIDRDRLLGPRGGEVPGDRTLTYFVAHEIAHTMVARRLGRVAYLRLETWQQEGYADHVGKGGSFDYDGALVGFRAGDASLDPHASGLYLRYHLLTEHLLRQGLGPEEILDGPRDAAPIEADLRREPR